MPVSYVYLFRVFQPGEAHSEFGRTSDSTVTPAAVRVTLLHCFVNQLDCLRRLIRSNRAMLRRIEMPRSLCLWAPLQRLRFFGRLKYTLLTDGGSFAQWLNVKLGKFKFGVESPWYSNLNLSTIA